jgi:hypothetical protein
MDKKNLPRHAAGAFELKEGTGGITGMCPCGDFLEIYKIDKTFRVQSPESIDPQQTNPNAMWVTTPISDDGSKNPIISRTMLQSHEILKGAWFERDIDKKAIILTLHACKENLLACDKIAKKISNQTNNIITKIQGEGIGTEKNARGLNPFPHITDLITDCDTFLTKAKRAIKSICELPLHFYSIDSSDNNFQNLSRCLASIIRPDSRLLNFINENAALIKHIIDLRNYKEHPGNRKTIIDNFRCTPDIKIVVPQWYITGKDSTPPTPIKEEMGDIVNYLLEITETMLILLVMDAVKKGIPFIIEKTPDSQINPAAPIKFNLSIDISKMRILK